MALSTPIDAIPNDDPRYDVRTGLVVILKLLLVVLTTCTDGAGLG